MGLRVVTEKRVRVPVWLEVLVPVGAVMGALIAGAVLLALLGVSPLAAYAAMLRGSLGDWYGISETLVKAVPLTLAGLAVALSFRMQVWNIGAEGQLYMGALAAAAAVRFAFVDNSLVMFCLMAGAAALAGGTWGAFAGYLKARWNVNEIITTLMLNYIAIHAVDYFVYGPWKDPASLGFPMTASFPAAARLPQFFDSRVHLGIFFAVVFAVLFHIVFRWTKWGFEVRVIGANPKAAQYAGINFLRNAVLVMFVSGAVAGFSGMCEMAGLQGRLQHGFSPGYGYTAIIVAWLARLNPLALMGVAFLLGALLVGGDTLQVVMRLPLSSIQVLQGLILFAVLGAEYFLTYRVRFIRSVPDAPKEVD